MGMHCTSFDVKMHSPLKKFSSKILTHHLHDYINEIEIVIGYSVIVRLDLMSNTGMSTKFKHIIMKWYIDVVTMKELKLRFLYKY